MLLFIFILLQVGKIKVTDKRVLKILRIHCQNSASIMTNGIRKVRQEWIFSTKELLILVSSSWTVLQNMASSTTIFSLQQPEY